MGADGVSSCSAIPGAGLVAGGETLVDACGGLVGQGAEPVPLGGVGAGGGCAFLRGGGVAFELSPVKQAN